MIYPAYLLCLLLMVPAFGLTAFIITILLLAAGPKEGWSVLFNGLAFFGAGLVEPLRYGWRIVALLAVIGLFLGAGAIPALRTLSFQALALMGTLCAVFCLYQAAQQDGYNVINALIVLSPSLAGIGACIWFALKFRTQ
jgi:hypothetical protein